MSSGSSKIRRFTDANGVKWRIEWRFGEIAMHVSPNLDIDRVPLPPGGLVFKSSEDAFFKQRLEVDPNDLTEAELQRMIDDA